MSKLALQRYIHGEIPHSPPTGIALQQLSLRRHNRNTRTQRRSAKWRARRSRSADCVARFARRRRARERAPVRAATLRWRARRPGRRGLRRVANFGPRPVRRVGSNSQTQSTLIWLFFGTPCLHRSHFGSRYKSGCCGHAGLLLFRGRFESRWFKNMPISFAPLALRASLRSRARPRGNVFVTNAVRCRFLSRPSPRSPPTSPHRSRAKESWK